MSFDHLFRPGSIGTLATPNRIVMPAMATNFASATGEPTEHLLAYYAARARGGAGVVIVENTTIEYDQGGNGAVQLRIDHDRYTPGLHRLAEVIRTQGAAAAVQINHAGAVARTADRKARPVGPSERTWSGTAIVPRGLHVEEIEGLVDAFAAAALRARRAGFDAVEIHGAHGYLIAQFLSPLMNRRTDRYGGARERRWRFALDVVRAVREAVGETFPVIFRISGDEFLPGGRSLDETEELAGALEEVGVDALHVTAATAANPQRQLEPMAYPEAWRIGLAAAVKRAVGVPVIGVGVIRTPETAARLLEQGKADFVAIGRGLIADPEWPRKAAAGKPETIRRCISCNRCVRHRVFDDLPIRCSVNPRVGREGEAMRPTRAHRLVAVIGGGPAGLSAAAAAAERGHRVMLLEAGSELGGRLLEAAVPPHKEKIAWLIEDLVAALPESVEVRCGARVSAGELLEMGPDEVVIAAGSLPGTLGVPGADSPHVHSVKAVLAKRVHLAGDVVVIGGGMVGCETAAFLAEAGCRVTLVEIRAELATDCEPITRADLIERLRARGVAMLVDASVREITAADVVIDAEAGTQRLAADAVVCAIRSDPDRSLVQDLEEAAFRVRVVGDAREVRGIYEAIHEGWGSARDVDEA